MNFVSIEF